MKEYYCREDDILLVKDMGCSVEHSRELNNVKIVLDFDNEDNIVGIEIFDFKNRMEESQKEIDRIFSKVEGKNNIQQETVATKRLDICPSSQSKDVIGCNARYPADIRHIKSEGKESGLTKV